MPERKRKRKKAGNMFKRFMASVIPAMGAMVLLSYCGKKESNDQASPKPGGEGADTSMAYSAMDTLNPASGGSPQSAATSAGHAFDGFYIHRAYLDGLKSSRSIYKTPFPNGSLYLQIHGDSVTLDYNNHEGGGGMLRVDTGTGLLPRPAEGNMGNGFISFRPGRGTIVQAWESGTDFSAEYRELPKSIRNIEELYSKLLLEGVYRCVGEGVCADTAILAGDSLAGLRGGTRRIRLTYDWMDNMPQMDYLDLLGSDTASWAFTVSADKLEFFAIDLPKECKSLEDYDCPLVDAKPGRKVFELIRVGGAPAGSESRL
jgi:hypothetical protein